MKRFSELSKEEIDRVAEKIRKISPKFEDLFRPEVGGSQEDIEYEQEVERIAARSENVYAVMPLREDQAEQENATNEGSKEEMNDSKKKKTQQKVSKKFQHSTDISSEESEDRTNRSKAKGRKPRQQSVLSRRCLLYTSPSPRDS